MSTRWAGLVIAALFMTACTPMPPKMPPGVEFRVLPTKYATRVKQSALGPLRFRGGVGLQARDPKFGTFSGLHVSADGLQLDAVGWGSWMRGRLEYNAAGELTGFSLGSKEPLKGVDGSYLSDKRDQDAEALMFDGQRYLVGFETNNRIWSYASPNGKASEVHLPAKVLRDVPEWGGFSSVSAASNNQIIALTEGGRDEQGNTKGYLFGGSTSGLIWLRKAAWLPVDLAMLPNGDLLLVEIRTDKAKRTRHNRISRIRKSEVQVGKVMLAETLAVFEPPEFYGKIEAAHAMPGENGQARIYLMSDTRLGWPTRILMFDMTDPN